MLKHASALALSLSVMSLAASPALAQAKAAPAKPTAAPAKPAAAPARPAAPVVLAQATAPALSAASIGKKTFEFSLMGGYRFLHGYRNVMGSTTANTTVNTADNAAPGTPATTNNKATNVNDNSQEFKSNTLQTGLSLSGSATYWLDPSFGLGLDYSFAHTGASLDNFISAGLAPKDTRTFDTDPADGTKWETKSTSISADFAGFGFSTDNSVASIGTGGTEDYKEFQVSRLRISYEPFNSLSGNYLPIDNAGAVGASGNSFINSDGAVPVGTAPNAATNEFIAKAKLGGTSERSTTLHMADVMTKTVIGANQRGELHLLAGLTIPMLSMRQVSTSVITGEDGTGAATQTVKHVDAADANNNFTQVIELEANRKTDYTETRTMVGPMIGLGGAFKVNDQFQLYGKFGYTPMMIGNSVEAQTITERVTVRNTYSDVGNTSGKTPGTTANEYNFSDVDGDNHYVTTGMGTSFVLGGRFALTESLGINVEGVNQSIAGFGYTGVNAGVSLGF